MWRNSMASLRNSWIGRWWTNGRMAHPQTEVNSSPTQSNTQYLIRLEDILAWRNKTRTLVGVAVTYIAIWLLYWMLMTPYYTISLCLMASLVCDAWLNFIWPEISLPRARQQQQLFYQFPTLRFEIGDGLSCHLHNVSNNFKDGVQWILQLRTNNSGLFCIVISILCLALAGMGTIFPGMVWAHLVFAAMWATRLGQNVPTLFQFSKDENRQSQGDLDDLIPQLSDDEIQVLEKAKDATYQSDSVPDETFHLSTIPAPDEIDSESSAIAELHFVPSHFDDIEADEFDELIPTPQNIYLEPLMGAFQRGKSLLNQLTMTSSNVSDSNTEEFEVISDSDFEN